MREKFGVTDRTRASRSELENLTLISNLTKYYHCKIINFLVNSEAQSVIVGIKEILIKKTDRILIFLTGDEPRKSQSIKV